MKKTIFILAIFVSLSGCKKDKETASELIVGKWEWVKTVGPWTEVNPQTTGYSQTIEFQVSGIMKEFRNDSLIISTNYNIESIPTLPDNYILTYNTGSRTNFYIRRDTLVFNNVYIDGPVSTYIRSK